MNDDQVRYLVRDRMIKASAAPLPFKKSSRNLFDIVSKSVEVEVPSNERKTQYVERSISF